MIKEPTMLSETDLDVTVERLIQKTSTALDQHIQNQKSATVLQAMVHPGAQSPAGRSQPDTSKMARQLWHQS